MGDYVGSNNVNILRWKSFIKQLYWTNAKKFKFDANIFVIQTLAVLFNYQKRVKNNFASHLC